MSSYDVAMELLKLEDEEFAEVFAWVKKAGYCIEGLDKADIELSKNDMEAATDITTLAGILGEIITDENCCSQAWWKGPTPKEKFLSKEPEWQQNALMETAMRAQEVFSTLHRQGEIKVDSALFDSYGVWEVLKSLSREFEYQYCDTPPYEDAFIETTEKYFTKRLKEFLTNYL